MKRHLIPFAFVIGLAACAEPKVDGTNDETFKASIAAIQEKLSAEDREQFQKDVAVLLLNGMDIGELFRGNKSAEAMAAETMKLLNGKSRSEISQHASKIRDELAKRERQQALSEIAELEKIHANAAKAKSELQKFSVERSRFYKYREKYSAFEKPIIELKVKNGTDLAVSRAYFEGTISTPGRSVPWIKQTFNYQIAGGLEPGESANWSLAPNMFSEWGKIDFPTDAVFTVEVIRLDGPDGSALYDATGLDEWQTARLEKLRDKYMPVADKGVVNQ